MKKVLLISSLISTVLVAAGYLFFISAIENFTIKELHLEETGENIYMKNLRRGLNYSEFSISTSKRRRINSSEDFVYSWDEVFFYKVSNDSLIVYCSAKAEEPKNFDSRIKVRQIVYSNPESFRLLDQYRNIGLQKFPE